MFNISFFPSFQFRIRIKKIILPLDSVLDMGQENHRDSKNLMKG